MSESVELKELLRRKITENSDEVDKPRSVRANADDYSSGPVYHLSSSDSEYTGGSVSYYKVRIDAPLSGNDAYTAECNDIIEALGMTYAEGNAFKAIWRLCAARTLGAKKRGYTDGLYDAEKVAFFGARMVAQERACKQTEPSA